MVTFMGRRPHIFRVVQHVVPPFPDLSYSQTLLVSGGKELAWLIGMSESKVRVLLSVGAFDRLSSSQFTVTRVEDTDA